METVRSPERRIEDFQVILKGFQKLEGMTSFGDSTISYALGNYCVEIPSDKSGFRIYFTIDGRGVIQNSGRCIDEKTSVGGRSLTPSEMEELNRPVLADNKIIDEVIATFKQGVEVSQKDKEIAIEEETEKMATAIRTNVLDITNLTVDSCKAKSGEIRDKKSKVAPSVVNSFEREEWEAVILTVREQIQSDDSFKKAA